MEQEFKRHIAYKVKIGDLASGKLIMEGEKFKLLEVGPKHIARINLVANIIDKFIQEGEKKFGSLTLDDASGQLRAKVFGDDLAKLEPFVQGDTVLVVGLLRSWNNELYITPEIIKKKEPSYLLVRKFELEADQPKTLERSELQQIRDSILTLVKAEDEKGGVEIERMILEFKASPEVINQEVKRLLEEGMVYEPRPGKLRYLG